MTMEQIDDKYSMERVLKDAGEKPVVFSFISYSCPYCKSLLSVLEKLCQEMPSVIFKIVNAKVSGDLMNEFGITGVPHTFLFKNGVMCYEVIGANKDLLLKYLMEIKN
ncbi:thioredoxin-like isoform X1 [Dendrobates tinctorius]|uniref:thioredoxin-like isoform X1 n=1 Tax=Dendrobates tinctorius TaxID=92724 RepID=UPI003CCA00E1